MSVARRGLIHVPGADEAVVQQDAVAEQDPADFDLKEWPAQIRVGFAILLQGYNYAQQMERDVWDFAVEIEDLKSNGLTNNDLRWMMWHGWVESARETTGQAAPRRVFDFDSFLTFKRHSCFVLSRQGVRIAERIHDNPLPAKTTIPDPRSGSVAPLHDRPSWDPECHRLYLGSELVKEFKLPSPNQGTVLMAFEEDDWPTRIDDPLPPSQDVDPKLRLRSTIKSLNRNQKKRLIRFMGDGSGQGIIWERVDARQRGSA